MELSDCKFYHGGDEMNFSILSDSPCRTRYIDSIPTPMTEAQVEVYSIEPGCRTQWVAVQLKNGETRDLKVFTRQSELFLEGGMDQLPADARKRIMLHFAVLPAENERLLAA
jgi:hypothetical protein